MTKQTIAHITLTFVTLIWGITFTIVKDTISFIDVYIFLFQRFLLAFLLFIPFVIFYKKEFHKKTFTHGLILGTLLFLAYAFQTIGLKYTLAANAAFVTGLNVVIVPIINSLLFKKYIPLNAKIGSVISSIGLALLCINNDFNINKGDIIVFFCAIFVALHIIYTDKYTKHNNAFNLAFVQMGTIALLSGICAIFYGNGLKLFVIHKNTIWAIILCSVFASNFAFWAQTYFQRFTIPTKTAIIFCGEPVFAAIFAYFYGGEILTLRSIFGGLLIIFSMIISEVNFDKVRSKKSMEIISKAKKAHS